MGQFPLLLRLPPGRTARVRDGDGLRRRAAAMDRIFLQSAQYRTTANSIFTVIKGSGRTIVDGEVMEWAMGDVIAVPAWRTYSHAVDSESFMVRASDEPVMRAIDMLRDEVLTART